MSNPRRSAVTPDEARAFAALRRLIDHLRGKKDATEGDEIDVWYSQLQTIEADAAKNLECSIALLGESGAGKSSLVNAMLGFDLLPNDAGAAVTASVTELQFVEAGFAVHVDLEDREHFLARFEACCGRLRESADTPASPGAALPPARDASDDSIVRAVTGMETDAFLQESVPGEEARLLLPEVNEALRSSTASWAGTDHQTDELRQQCRLYLSARKPVWPLVRRVTIKGPFLILRSGLRVVDIPGLNDPDPVRTRVAEDAVQHAQLVWLVLNGKRAMTGALTDYLTKSRLLTRLQLEGRLASLVLIVTHADQLNEQALIDEFKLPQDASLDTLLDRHRERTSTSVRRSLMPVWDETVQQAAAHVEPSTVRAGVDCLRATPLFSVSSTESLALRGVVKTKKPPFMQRDEQTEIPRLVQWTMADFVAKEEKRHRERVAHRTQQLVAAIRSTLGARAAIKKKIAGMQSGGREGLKGLQQEARTFLTEQLKEHESQAKAEIGTRTERVTAAIRSGVEAAEQEICQGTREQLGEIHWATLRAIAWRNGVFKGSTRDWDLPNQIAATVTRRVAFRWAELFEASTKQFLEGVVARSTDLLAAHTRMLYALVTHAIGGQTPGMDPIRQPAKQIELELELITADITERLQAARMRFERDLVESLRVGLRPAFEKASLEYGRGMKSRMVECLAEHLDDIAPDLLPGLTHDLDEKVVEVKGILGSQVTRAHRTVERVARLDSRNLEVALFNRSPAELMAAAEAITEGLRFLDAA